MREAQNKGKTYVIEKMNALDALNVGRRLGLPLLSESKFFESYNLEHILEGAAKSLSSMNDVEFNYCVFKLLSTVKLKTGNSLVSVVIGDSFSNCDISLDEIINLCIHSVRES